MVMVQEVMTTGHILLYMGSLEAERGLAFQLLKRKARNILPLKGRGEKDFLHQG